METLATITDFVFKVAFHWSGLLESITPAPSLAFWSLEKEYWRVLLPLHTAVNRSSTGSKLALVVVEDAGKTQTYGEGLLGKLTSTKYIVNQWREYFEGLFNPTDAPSSEEAGPGDPGMGSLISKAELAEVVKKLLGGSAPVVNEICPEYLKVLDVVRLS